MVMGKAIFRQEAWFATRPKTLTVALFIQPSWANNLGSGSSNIAAAMSSGLFFAGLALARQRLQ